MRRAFLLAPAFACLLAAPAFAADATEDPTSAATTVQATTAVPPVVSAEATEAALAAARAERAQRIELNARMTAVLETSQKTVAGLQKMIEATTDPVMVRDLEKRMMQAKQETTLDLMRVQATFARENGRIAQAEQIEAEIAEVLAPKRIVPSTSAARTGAVAPAGGAR